MREYKFRAWDKSNQCMVYPGEENTVFTFTNGILCVECLETVWKEGGGEIYEKDEFFQVDCEIMQFTGLKENAFESGNKDIYESDIIEFINGERLVVEWNDDKCQFQYSDGTPINNGKRYGSHKMIIGNIYESPELLK